MVFGGADTNRSKVRDPVDVYSAMLFGSESWQQHPAAQVELPRRHRLARQGVGQTSSGGEEPAGRAERLRKGLFGGLEAVEPVGKSVFSVNRDSGFRIQAKLRCLTAVFDCGGFTAKGCFGSPARWVRGSDAGQVRAEAERSELLR